MRSTFPSLAALAALSSILVMGCGSSGRPLIPTVQRGVKVSGVVRYLSGQPADRAKVETDTGDATFTDSSGHYAIAVAVRGDSITVRAEDGYDGRVYAETHSGSVRVLVGDRGARADIVLDHVQII